MEVKDGRSKFTTQIYVGDLILMPITPDGPAYWHLVAAKDETMHLVRLPDCRIMISFSGLGVLNTTVDRDNIRDIVPAKRIELHIKSQQ